MDIKLMVEFGINSQAKQEKRQPRRRPQGIKVPTHSTPTLSSTLEGTEKYLSSVPVHELFRTEASLGSVTPTQGSFASVRAVTELSSGLRFAAKIAEILDSSHLQKAIREYEILSELNHPAVVKVVKLIVDEGARKSYMLMPIENLPSLASVLDNSGVLCLSEVRQLAKELFDALAYIHRRNIIHRDINPNNILYSAARVKLIDFNTARRVSPGQSLTNSVGTHSFKSPEMQAGLPYNQKADVWSLAATLVKALGRPAQDHFEDLEVETRDFFARTLVREPESRLSAQEACEHVWLRQT